MDRLGQFREIWVVDTEFHRPLGWLPSPVCCVAALELRSGREVRLWTEHGAPQPFDTCSDNLFVAQYATVDWLAFMVLGWQVPMRVIDTYVEARLLTNGFPGLKGPGDDKREGRARGCGLTSLARHYGIPAMPDALKDVNRKLAMRGGPWSAAEQRQMLGYCTEDVSTTAKVFLAMLDEILTPRNGLAHALIRGRYTRADAAMNHVGIPVDVELHRNLKTHRQQVRRALIEMVDPGRFDCFEDGRFKERNLERLIVERWGLLDWPRTEHGKLKRDEKTLRDLAGVHPDLGELRELFATLKQLQDFNIGVGPDRRHRADFLSPFGGDTARHTPTKFIFSLSAWFRGIIKPAPEMAVLYSDYSGQEVYIAAWLSQDPNMLAAVGSGDPYLWFLKRTGRVPQDAAKSTHREIRDWIKPFLLGSTYGLSEVGAALRLGISSTEAEALVEQHKELFDTYWRWIEAKVQTAYDKGEIRSRWGWRMYVGTGTRPRSVQNHPIQNMGAHILQFAVMGLTESGVRVCAPVHDAVLTECSISEIHEHKAKVERIMRQAAKVGLGMEIPVGTETIAHPARYVDVRGAKMFTKVTKALESVEVPVAGLRDRSRPERIPSPSTSSSFFIVTP